MRTHTIILKSLKPTLVLGSIGLLLLTAFQNCAPQAFTQATDQQSLAGSPIFNYANTGSPATGDGAAGGVTGGGGAGGATGGVTGGGGGGGADGGVTGTGGGGGADGTVTGTGGGGADGTVIGMPGQANHTTGGGTGPGTGDAGGEIPGMPGQANTQANPNDGMNVPDESKIPTSSATTIPVNFVCSVRFSVQAGGNLASLNSLLVELVPAESNSLARRSFLNSTSAIENNQPACSFTDSSLPAHILQNKTFPFSVIDQRCPSLAAGSYYLVLRAAAGMPPLNEGEKYFSVPVVQKEAGEWSMRNNQTLSVVADYNPNSQNSQYPPRPYLKLSDDKCDDFYSPLVVRIVPRGQTPQRLVLSSPESGVLFDILGANAFPTPYTPVKISWLYNLPQFYFVALPDANGQVRGIDQLFGDNTKGPDGKFADNGYLALKKFDSNSDDVIDAKDTVFSSLRLWNDTNSNGVSESTELFTMQHMGVVSISLKYDSRYYEMDRYGNEIKYKSLVKMSSGRNQIMFDLWFHTK